MYYSISGFFLKGIMKEIYLKKHVPIRTCIACRKKLPQVDFFALCKIKNENSEKIIIFDENQTLAGRHVYFCKKPQCLNIFLSDNAKEQSKKVLNYSLKTSISSENFKNLHESLEKLTF